MVLKELVLTSLESFEDFMINDKPLNREMYLELADKEIEKFYLDVVDGEAKCFVTLVE